MVGKNKSKTPKPVCKSGMCEVKFKPLAFKKFKGVYYAYQERYTISGIPCWVVAEHPSKQGRISYYNADHYRIDQAIQKFINDGK
jgi:hypothetical protein